jgi:dTDP-glucose pyrophosphorylase
MEDYRKYLLSDSSSIKDALIHLDKLAQDATVFIVDADQNLVGAITDGDIRRGLIEGKSAEDSVSEVLNKNPRFVRKGENAIDQLIEYRAKKLQVIPVLNKDNDQIINVINFRRHRSYLPIDAVIMAGGKGQRLRPLTENTPKPLLKVGDTPIIERNIDRLAMFGIDDVHISVNYLGEQLEDYFGNGQEKGIRLGYVWEDEPLGTIGAVSKIDNFKNDYILVMNSDLLTNIDFENFFIDFLNTKADFSVLSLPYKVDVPYAVLETEDGKITSLKEKPSYTYYSNGGIYLMKREVLERIPHNSHYNATDLIESLIEDGKHVRSFPMVGYWLDIGNHDDFKKAQNDVEHIRF